MNRISYDYIKAYHAEIKSHILNEQISKRKSNRFTRLWIRFLNYLGDNLITLGERIKCKIACAEFSQSQA